MSERHKDNKGRILKTGESQRKDGTYMFRYSNIRKNKRCVYAATLEELRIKESQIMRDLDDGIDYSAGEITVLELVQKYTRYKQGVSKKTQQGYKFVLNLLSNEDFGYRRTKSVKQSDCKAFL